MNECLAFVKHLQEHPDDDAARLIYADCLEDNDQPEEALRQRRWRECKDWMDTLAEMSECPLDLLMNAANDIADTIESGGDGDYRGEEQTYPPAGNLLRDNERLKRYWDCWSVLTGRAIPRSSWNEDRPPRPFGCCYG